MAARIIVGNCLDELRKLPDDSVQVDVSSPPYWGLRDYGIEPSIWGGDPACEHEFVDETVERQIRKGMDLEELGKRYRGGGKKHGKIATFQIHRGSCPGCGAWRGALGLEPTPEMFVEHMVMIYEEVRRVLRPDGVAWVNMGDSYAGSGRGGNPTEESSTLQGGQTSQKASIVKRARMPKEIGATARAAAVPARGDWSSSGLKSKDLVGVPWMLAFALRRAGWYLRQDIIWQKPNPMPESTEDRCTKAHEYIFLLSKSERYFYDADAIKEIAIYNEASGKIERPKGSFDGKRAEAESELIQGSFRAIRPTRNKRSVWTVEEDEFQQFLRWKAALREFGKPDVWTVATRPFPGAHFATFPPELIEPCILAGSSERGACPACRAAWRRVTAPTERYAKFLGRSYHDHANDQAIGMMQNRAENRAHPRRNDEGLIGKETETIGWYPTCGCDGLAPLPKLPQSPRLEAVDAEHPTDEEKAALEAARDLWREACAAVHAERALLCAPAAKLPTVPCVVLDHFGGAGTTGLVADRQQRDSILIEMNPEYAEMARRRIDGEAMPLFSTAAAE